MSYIPRLTKPEDGNPYYNTKANGGYSVAIQGKPTDPGCDVLSNCVGYAYGRFNEIGGYGSCRYLYPTNAENFLQYAKGLETGDTPRVGACMVWRKGATLSGSDGAGHVAIVEKVISTTEVITSESGWGDAVPFKTRNRKKGSNGRWGSGEGYTFLGFIYNPASCCEKEPDKEEQTVNLKTLSKGAQGEDVRAMQLLLMGRGMEMRVQPHITAAKRAHRQMRVAFDTGVFLLSDIFFLQMGLQNCFFIL